MGLCRTIRYCLKLRRHDKYTVEQIDKVQQKNLRKVVSFAKKRSPFYRKLYSGIDVNAPGFSIKSLPPVTKELIMENFDKVVTDSRIKLDHLKDWVQDEKRLGQLFLGKYIVTHTSGTTGKPAYFVYSLKEWDWIQAHSVTRGIRFKPGFKDYMRSFTYLYKNKVRVALVSVLSGHFITYIMFLIKPRLGKMVSKFDYMSVVAPVDKLVKQLNEKQPNLLHSYPTMLEILAYEQLEGHLKINPWIITSSSEPLTLSARRVIERAFQIQFNDDFYQDYADELTNLFLYGVLGNAVNPLETTRNKNHDR